MPQNLGMVLRLLAIALFFCFARSIDAAPHVGATFRFDQAELSWSQAPSPPAQFEAGVTPLPSEWEALRPAHAGQAWYRIRFDAPPADLAAVFIERACTNANIWLNGSLINANGALLDPITRHCYHPYWAAMPVPLLKSQGNVLDIQLAGYAFDHVAARQRHAALSGIWIGSQQELRARYDEQYFWNITIAQIIGVSLAVFGMVILMLFALRKQDRHFLYFGLTMIGWALLGIRLYWEHMPLTGWASEMLIISSFPPVVGCAIQFLMHYVRQPKIMVTRLLVLQAVAVPTALLLMGADWIFRLGSLVFTTLAVEFMVALVYAGWHAWRQMRTDFWIVGSALVAASLMTLAEIAIQNNWMALPRIHLIHFGLPWVFLAITTRLVQQFAQSLRRSEHMTEELEQRVAEKGHEIQSSYEQISLLRANEAAQQERKRIAADLHDDLGAKLLSIIHSETAQTPQADRPSAASIARQALDEMRLSVRGLTAQPAPIVQVLADWRTEIMERSYAAGLQTTWYADEPPAQLILGARAQMQLTRILREAVSNMIRHAHAKNCEIHILIDAAMIEMRIDDDGRGLGDAEVTAQGHGLNNIERRARSLGGQHQFERSALGGASISVRVPLGSDSQPMPL
jgi:two-component system, NarL family, sensor histidine kinase UhpB